MESTTPALEPTPTPAPTEAVAAPAATDARVKGPSIRRMVVTAGLAGMLLVAGGVAAVSAASPDSSAAPGTTTTPSGKPAHNGVNCPNMGTNGAGGGSSSNGSSAGGDAGHVTSLRLTVRSAGRQPTTLSHHDQQPARDARLRLFLAGCTAPGAASNALVDIGDGIQGPAGVTATSMRPACRNVAALDFDDAGRLWVATAAFTDAGTDAIYRIDAAGSTPIKVVDGLHTVLGLVWTDDTLFVASAGRVDAYAAPDGDELAAPTTVLTLPDGVGEVNGTRARCRMADWRSA